MPKYSYKNLEHNNALLLMLSHTKWNWHTLKQHPGTQRDACAHARTRARARTHTHTNTHARMHARTHARAHTHTHTQRLTPHPHPPQTHTYRRIARTWIARADSPHPAHPGKKKTFIITTASQMAEQLLSKRTEWTGNLTMSVGIQHDSARSYLSTHQVSVSTCPPASALEEL